MRQGTQLTGHGRPSAIIALSSGPNHSFWRTLSLTRGAATYLGPDSMKHLVTVPALALSLLLSGCSSDPWSRDTMARVPSESLRANKDEQIRMGYLARYLAEPNTRARLEGMVLETKYVTQWTASEYATATSLASDFAVGEVGSSLGSVLGSTVFVAGLLSGDGSHAYVSQAFLPETLAGKALRTPEEARAALVALMDDRLRGVAQTLNTDIECFHGCETPNRVYRMTLSGTGLERFPYVPEQILVALNIGTVVAAKPADPISALVGFPVKWQSVPANTASVRLFDTPAKLTKGPLEIATVADDYVYPAGWRSMDQTTMGTQILATLYATPYTLWGANRGIPSRIYYNGNAYGFSSNGYPDFVDKRLTVPLLKP